MILEIFRNKLCQSIEKQTYTSFLMIIISFNENTMMWQCYYETTTNC